MALPTPGVADIIRHAGPGFRETHAGRLDALSHEVLESIARCRTAELGGHLYQCTHCERFHVAWHSCGNRHCPSCQGAAARAWMTRQAGDVLPVPYFHVVFTLPRPIARIALQNRKTVFDILFRCAADTIKTISADPRRLAAHVGGTAVLHTWNQKMEWHPHLHCLVPNGGFDINSGAWKTGSDHFFAPVRVLARFFRNRFLENLAKADLAFHGASAHLADREAFEAVLREARAIEWNVYAKRPFNGPEAVIRYLSRYTHRIAISDARIIAFDGDTVTIRHRKPVTKAGEKPSYGTMNLDADAFIRRFLLHRLPRGLHRIRHFGILANGCRAGTLDAVRSYTGAEPDTADDDTTDDVRVCAHCGAPLRLVLDFGRTSLSPERRALLDALLRQRGPPPPEPAP